MSWSTCFWRRLQPAHAPFSRLWIDFLCCVFDGNPVFASNSVKSFLQRGIIQKGPHIHPMTRQSDNHQSKYKQPWFAPLTHMYSIYLCQIIFVYIGIVFSVNVLGHLLASLPFLNSVFFGCEWLSGLGNRSRILGSCRMASSIPAARPCDLPYHWGFGECDTYKNVDVTERGNLK